MTRQGRFPAIATLVVTALVAAGCGGDDEASDEFATEVGTICEETQQKFAEAKADLVLRDDTYVKEFKKINEPLFDDYISELEAVEPPSGEEEAYDAYVTAIRGQAELFLDNPLGSARAGLGNKETEFSRTIAALNEDAVAAGEELGLPAVCTTGTGGSTSEPAPAE